MSRIRLLFRRLLTVLAAVAAASPALTAAAQDSVLVRIDTNWPEAVVVADAERYGPVQDGLVYISPLTEVVRLVPPDRSTWSIRPVSRQVHAAPGDSVVLEMRFPFHYQVESVPYGATVFRLNEQRERVIVGTTPLRFKREAPLVDTLLVEKDGYETRSIDDPGAEVWNTHLVRLPSLTPALDTSAEVDWEPPGTHRTWIDMTALGATAAAAAVSIHYKFKADRLYDDYLKTGDPTLPSRIRAYDTRAAVGLGAMQVGLGFFAIRLVLR